MTDDVKNLDETETVNFDNAIRKLASSTSGDSKTLSNLADDNTDDTDTDIDEKKTVKYSEMMKKLKGVNEDAFIHMVLVAVLTLALGLLFGSAHESEKSYINYKVVVEVNNVTTIDLVKFRDNLNYRSPSSDPLHLKNMVIKKEGQKLVLTAIYRGDIDVNHMRKVMHKVKDALKNEAMSITCDVVDYKTGAQVTSKL